MDWARASRHLGRNLETLRHARDLSQQQLADLAGLPRSTLSHLESGDGNPSLHNLLTLTEALGLSIEELISPPRSAVAHVRAKDLVKKTKGPGVEISLLLPEAIAGLEFEKLRFKPGARLKGSPHIQGTKEYFHCLRGEIHIYVLGEKFQLQRGDLLAFPGDTAHAYKNASATTSALGLSVVSLARPALLGT